MPHASACVAGTFSGEGTCENGPGNEFTTISVTNGSFNVEQRTLVSGDGFVDLSHRDVFRVTGPDRLTWLHSLTTQHLEALPPGTPTQALVLSPQGHVEHHFHGVDDDVWRWELQLS